MLRAPARLLLLMLAGLAAGSLAGCRPDAAPAVLRPVVAVSVAPQAELVARLAGEGVGVVTMIPAGTDVETYSPTPQQMASFANAKLYFAVGHPAMPLERAYVAPWLARHPEVLEVRLADHAGGLLALHGDADPSGDASAGDPHLWMSVRAMRAAAGELAAALAAALPAEAAAIGARAAALDAELAALDAELTVRFAPAAGRRFLVYHPALGYFARDYGLTQEAIEAEGKEPSPARLAALIERGRRAGLAAVLGQRGMPPKSVEILAGALGAKVIEIDPMAADWQANLRRVADAVAEALVDG